MITPNAAETKGLQPKASAAPLPSAMPRKVNPLHQQILAALLDNRQTVREETREKREKNGRWVRVPVKVPVATLAGNVSELNVDRAARRWMP